MFSTGIKSRPSFIGLFVATLIGIGLLVQIVSGYPALRYARMTRSLSQAEADSAEQSFRKFIKSIPDSTVIGELRPDMSDIELAVMKEKISDSIKSIQELDKQRHAQRLTQIEGAECYIDTSKGEKIPGKCRKVGDGLPICQSDSYISVDSTCSSSSSSSSS